MVNFGRAIGGLTGGLAQGIQAGQEMAYRKQAMDMQRHQIEMQTAEGVVKVMQIEDPAVREFAMKTMLPTMGITEDSAQYKNILLLNKTTTETRAATAGYIADMVANGDATVKDFFVKLGDPKAAIGMMGDIATYQHSKAATEELGKESARQDTALRYDAARLKIAQQSASTEATQAQTAADRQAAQDARQADKDAQESFDKGLTLMDAAGSIADHDARLARVQRIAVGHPELGLTPEGMETWAANPGMTYDQIEQAAKAQAAVDVAPFVGAGAEADLARKQAEATKAEAEAGTAGETADQQLLKLKEDVKAAVAANIDVDKERAADLKKKLLEISALETKAKNAPQEEEKTKLEIDKLRGEVDQITSGAKADVAERKEWLSLRAQGIDDPKMPSRYKMMPQKVAAKQLAALQTQRTVAMTPDYLSPGNIGKINMNIESIRRAEDVATQAIDLLTRTPEAGGIRGTIVEPLKRVVGAGEDIMALLRGTKEGKAMEMAARRDIASNIPLVPDDIKKEVGGILSKKDITLSKIIETQLALAAATATGQGDSRQLRQEYEDAKSSVALTGLTSTQAVIDSITYYRDNILKARREGLSMAVKRALSQSEEDGGAGVSSYSIDRVNSDLDDMDAPPPE